MNPSDLPEIIAQGESLSVEFKSDRGPLDDSDLLGTVVCMANAQGGTLFVGVEDDGTVTSLPRDAERLYRQPDGTAVDCSGDV